MKFDVASLSVPFHNPCIVGVEYATHRNAGNVLLWFKCDYLAITVRGPGRSLYNLIHPTIVIFIHDGADFSSFGERGALAAFLPDALAPSLT